VHYRPRTLVLNNLEYDHADIYKDIDAILWQFHQLLRTVPGSGRIILNSADENLAQLIDQGCWTPIETFSTADDTDWTGRFGDKVERHIGVRGPGNRAAETRWRIGGVHNLENAVAAVAAAASAGVPVEQAVDSLARFEGVKRRMERTATVADIAIYDDFAHHPTAIARSIQSMRKRYPGHRVVVAVEPCSNTMKLGVHNEILADSLQEADLVWVYRDKDMGVDFDASLERLGTKLRLFDDYDRLVNDMSKRVLGGDQVVFMSNGSFGSARQTLTALLQRMRSA
jgi:UDP-N-acetylmuramate: L-alanyl-gamma-D-glutamyl-meso-diaminopimelate ligase